MRSFPSRDIILVPLNQHSAYRRNFKEDQSAYLDESI